MISLVKDSMGLWIAIDQDTSSTALGKTPQAAITMLLKEPMIQEARTRIREEFEKDPDWKQTYIDNVACLLMDRLNIREKEVRDKVAEQIIDLIFKE